MSTERPYRSTLREERASETRQRIRRAAADLFTSEGFAETTVAQIAERAGVATQTVYAAFGTKGGIVAAMLEELENHADQDVWVSQIVASDDPRHQLRLFSGWIRNLYEGGADIIRAAVGARSQPDVAAMADQGDEARRGGTRRLTRLWETAGALRDDLDAESAAERMWLITSVEQYLNAVDRLGWTPDDYETWLTGALERELLAPN